MSIGTRSHLIRRSLILAMGVILLGIAGIAVAGHYHESLEGSEFEIETDANLVFDEGLTYDWANVDELRQIDEFTGQDDDSFGQGSKEDTEVPAVVSGSIPPNKSDLEAFGVYVEDTGTNKFLHLYWTRVQDPSGTTNMDFEFNQSTTLSGNGVTPERTADDLLVVYELAKGGTVPQLFLLEWIDNTVPGATSADCDANNTLPCWGNRRDLTGSGAASGSINMSPIAGGDSDGLGPLDPRTFGEASIDLDIVFDNTKCSSFGSAYLKSRSSDSFTAALKDFIAPQPVDISNCGKVAIVKNTLPTSGNDTFDFTKTFSTDPQSSDNFSLTTVGGTAQTVYADVLVGTGFSVTESEPPTGWSLTGLSCTSSEGQTITPNLETRTATFDVAVDEEITCTFTNTAKGTIVVVKDADPDGAQDFAFTDNIESPNAFDLDDDEDGTLSDTKTFSNVTPGTYDVTESATSGWDLTDVTCVDPDGGSSDSGSTATIDLDPGETVTCTFTNTKRGKIVIDKVTDPISDTTTQFDFDASWLGSNPGGGESDVKLTNDQTPFMSAELVPGSYAVTELAESGWDLTDVTCVDPDGGSSDSGSTATIDLDPGETVTCTFTNQKDAFIKVDKVTDPSGDVALFDFDASWLGANPGGGESDFQLADATTPYMSGDLTPGTYSVAELAKSGWDLTGSSCSSTQGGDASTPASISLQAGETVTCTFTNQKDAFIKVDKVTDPSGDVALFDFDASWLGANPGGGESDFQLADATTPYMSGDLTPGTYSVAELAKSGWDLTGSSCSSTQGGDASTPASISLQAGETVTCTFTNQKDAFIKVDKVTDPSGDVALFDFDASWLGANPGGGESDFQLADATTPYMSGDLTPGTYSVAELAKSGWDLTGSSCSSTQGGDASTPASISLQAGETVTCTFTNQKDAFIKVDKVTDPSGDVALFDFDASWLGANPGGGESDFQLADATTPYMSGDLTPGTYSVAELAKSGWDLTGSSCSSTQGGDASTPASISLQAGETVTCTFTNQKDAFIKVDKVTDPSGDVALFDFDASWLGANPGGGESDFQLADATTPYMSGDLTPGTYSVAELAKSGWDLTGSSCSSTQGGDASTPASISLQAGETVTCAFTNTKRGDIDILKTDDAGNPLENVTFSLFIDVSPFGGQLGNEDVDTGTNCTTDANGKCSFDNLVPGPYWVVEDAAPDGHVKADPQAITVAPGDLDDDVELTFINPRLHKVIVFVCHMGTDDLLASDVTLDGVTIVSIEDLPSSFSSLGITEAMLCGLQGFEDLGHESVSPEVDIGSVGGNTPI